MASLPLTPLSGGAGRSRAREAAWEPAGGGFYSLYCDSYHGFSRTTCLKHIAPTAGKQHIRQCVGEKSICFGIKEVSMKCLHIFQEANFLKSLSDNSPNQNKP